MVRLFAAGLVAAALGSQIEIQTPRQTMPPRPTPLGVPTRDARPAATGTAIIRGRIFAADTNKPLRRARITVQAPELGGEPRSTSTNADGRYEIKELPAGRYTITVARSGYLQLRYGQRRPFELGKQLQLTDRQLADNVDFTLPRMSLITGRIFDEAGEPISGVRVMAMRSVFFEGRRRLVPAFGPMVTSDDAGQYRILGLSPGSYFVTADIRETWTVSENGVETVMGYANTYFPGVAGLSEARRITVGIAQEVANQDFALVPGRAATVSGVALDSLSRPIAGRQIGLAQEFKGPGNLMIQTSQGATTGPDGTFTMKNVPPGEYKLILRTTTERDGGQVQEAAAALVAVNNADISNVTLMASAGWNFMGRLITESGEAPPIAFDRFRVVGRPLNTDNAVPGLGGPPGAGDSGRMKDDWTFSVSNLFGPVRVRITGPDEWMVKSIRQEGRDITDAELEGHNGETVGNVEIVVTNKTSTVSGQLLDDRGAAILDGTVIVFSTDASKWTEDSRYVRAVRPDQEGKFQIRGLPPGQYLAIAIEYVEEGMWNDPEYLEPARRDAQPLSLSEGESKSVSLKVVRQ